MLIVQGHAQCTSEVPQQLGAGLLTEPCCADPPVHVAPGRGAARERQLDAGHAAGGEEAAQVGLVVDVDGTE